MAVKRPRFTHPRGAGSPTGTQPIPADLRMLDVGTKVSLWYKKRTVVVRIEKVGPQQTFEGAIEAFEPPVDSVEGLSVGDSVGFRRDNVRWVH